jgi:tetratricopeptide (TPR) repeat protein
MRRAALLLSVLALVVAAARPVRAVRQAALEALYAAYLAGDANAIGRQLRTEADFRALRGDIFLALRDARGAWRPSRATFLLELSLVGSLRGWTDASLLLTGARDLVLHRPAPIGTRPAEDAFEITFHRTAVALLVSRRELNEAVGYLTAIAPRVRATPGTGEPTLVDPRIALVQACIRDVRTAPFEASVLQDPDRLPSLTIDPNSALLRTQSDAALAAYREAERLSPVADEARVRRGLLLHRLGRQAEALAALDVAPAAGADPAVDYWRMLFRGRVLQALDRPEEAAAAYEAAARGWPGAQTPAVALAALAQQQDRPDDARRWAALARTTSADTIDPWWQYWTGDFRFAGSWFDDLRQVRP